MKRIRCLFIFAVSLLLSACTTNTTRIYYWEKANTGGERFVQDHNACLKKADLFPWTIKYPWEPELLNLRLNLKNGGIWANFSPYKGAMPIFVNTATPSRTVVYWRYAMCMRNAGYKERRPYGGPM